jgi:hypothetical protein
VGNAAPGVDIGCGKAAQESAQDRREPWRRAAKERTREASGAARRPGKRRNNGLAPAHRNARRQPRGRHGRPRGQLTTGETNMVNPYPILAIPPDDPAAGWNRERPPRGAPLERLARPGGWLRFDTGLLQPVQAIKNLETVVSLLQTGADAVEDVAGLVSQCLLAVNKAWAGGDRRQPPPAELAEFLRSRLRQIDERVGQCRFHGRGLLDGQSGVTGLGMGVVFVRGGPNTKASPPEGFEARVLGFPSRAVIVGGVTVDESWLRAEQEIFLAEGDNYLRTAPRPDETVAEFLARLQEAVVATGLDLEVALTRQRRLAVRHNQYGSQFKFKGSSRSTPLLSKRPGKVEWSRRGRDIQGTLDGEPAFGIGRMLVGYLDNARTSELAVLWRSGGLDNGRGARVHVAQNGLLFQESDAHDRPLVRLTLPALHTWNLGRWVETRSGFASLADVRVDAWPATQDTLNVLFAVSCELDDWKERMGGWEKRFQNQALAYLRRRTGGGETPLLSEQRSREAEDMARLLREAMRSRPAAAE